MQTFAFLNEYRKLRGECQEVYYNLGRACQHLSLHGHAINFYKKALSMPVTGNTSEESQVLDLTYEIGYNLYQLYLSIGAKPMAYLTLQKYLVI
ncbi:General transcription factor IIIC, polypeptide 3 [Cichlidogyrus casuarinus]|uniref:General transcription factor IIIC, polypeptide 3 n=1 Tax=Cichlidogyrus casuarinus TaxID=1844966 RepID=A0ABD2PZH5_9PLAT